MWKTTFLIVSVIIFSASFPAFLCALIRFDAPLPPNKPPAIKLNSALCPDEENGSWGDVFCCAFTLTSLINTLPSHPAPGFPLWLLIKPLTQMTPLSSPSIYTLNNAQTRVSTVTKNNLLASNHSYLFSFLFFFTWVKVKVEKLKLTKGSSSFPICPWYYINEVLLYII